MLGIIRMLLVGLVVGIVARFLYPGAVPMGLLASALLGIAGSVAAGLVAQLFSPASSSQPFHPAGILFSLIGSLVLIFIARSVLHIV